MSKTLTGKSIVFDWGNTLVFDPFNDIKDKVAKKAADIALNEFQTQFNLTSFLKGWTNANNEINFQYASHFSQEEPWIQAGLKAAGIPDEIRALIGPKILAIYRQEFKELLINDPRKTQLRKTLQELKNRGKHLAVLSNDRSFTPKSTLTWLEIADLFDHFLTSEEIGVEKPNPKVFEIASKRFGRPIQDIIYVGDDPVRDVQCAHRAGAKSVLYIPPKKYRTNKSWRDYSNYQDKADAVITDLKDLLEVIKES